MQRRICFRASPWLSLAALPILLLACGPSDPADSSNDPTDTPSDDESDISKKDEDGDSSETEESEDETDDDETSSSKNPSEDEDTENSEESSSSPEDEDTTEESGDSSNSDDESDTETDSSDPDGVVLVDKNCVDGQYIVDGPEQFLEVNAFPDISDLIAGYNESQYMQFIYGVLERRYPTGKSIIEQGGGQSAVDSWLWSKDSAQSVLGSLGLAIHEIGHGIDKQSPENWYFIAKGKDGKDVAFTVPGMHGKVTTSSSPMYSMERSLLLADDQNYLRPPASSSEIKTSKEFGEGEFGTDASYAETYLTGDPTDNDFDSGDQGYNSLIEEFTQYTNSIAFAYYFQDINAPRASSDRHAMLTWMWWNERYLRKIRKENPEQHAYLLNNKTWIELILTLWGRGWMYLRTDLPGMQPDSDQLHELIRNPELLEEIQILRRAYGCDAPVELLPEFADPTAHRSDGAQNH